ncbi:uncharacterized protein LOC62_03G004344 [Vanrija pseudolonga]|uniref:Uncharacterized protein n=1 Tax=Vanrija pseudolonga TaxID=143232 RepID=A0AAF1BH93_9TREE|nr:hypothetical protein LOC62_03G004344 [Vanrija pseudolonga]
MSSTRTQHTTPLQQVEVDTDPLTAAMPRLAATREAHTALLHSLVRQQEEQGRTLAALLRRADDNPGAAMVRAVSGAMRDLVKTQARQGYALLDVMGDVRAVMRAVGARELPSLEGGVAASLPVGPMQPRIDRRRMARSDKVKAATTNAAAKSTPTPATKIHATASSLPPKPASLPPRPARNQSRKPGANAATTPITSSTTPALTSAAAATSTSAHTPPANAAYCTSWNLGQKNHLCKALNCALLHECFVCHPIGAGHGKKHRYNPQRCGDNKA